MDLTLALGYPISGMSERQFSRWVAYARSKSFPLRRIEFYLAQIAMFIAQTMGGAEDASIEDYLFDPQRDEDGRLAEPEREDPVEAARRAFAFNPRR